MLRAATAEFNKGTLLFNTRQFREAIPLFQRASFGFKKTNQPDRALYANELYAKCLDRLSDFHGAIRGWVMCIVYSLRSGTHDKLSWFVQRFAKSKARYWKSTNSDVPSLSQFAGSIKPNLVPPQLVCEEIEWYIRLRVPPFEKDAISDLLRLSDGTSDAFYKTTASVLQGLMEERRVRIKDIPDDFYTSVLFAFNKSDHQLVEAVLPALHRGVSSLQLMDRFLGRALLEVAHVYYHQGQLMSQIRVLQMLLGSPSACDVAVCNCYLARTYIDVGNMRLADGILSRVEGILEERRSASPHNSAEEFLGEDDDDDDELILKSLDLDYENEDEESAEAWFFAGAFCPLLRAYYHIELNQLGMARRLIRAVRDHRLRLPEEEDYDRRASGLVGPKIGKRKSSLPPGVESRLTHARVRLGSVCDFYEVLAGIRSWEPQEAVEVCSRLLDTFRSYGGVGGRTVEKSQFVPRHMEMWVAGKLYELMGCTGRAAQFYKKGVRLSVYTRTRCAASMFVLALAHLEVQQLHYDDAERLFSVLEQLFDGEYINHPLMLDDLHYDTVLYIQFLLLKSELHHKSHVTTCLPTDSLEFAIEMIRNNSLPATGCSSVRDVCAKAREVQALFARSSGDVDKTSAILDGITRTENLPSVTRTRALLGLAQAQLRLRHSAPESYQGAERILRACLDKASVTIPSLTKPLFSAMGLVLRGQQNASAYYSAMSMGICLRHEKLQLLRRKMHEKERNHETPGEKTQELLRAFEFKKSETQNDSKLIPRIADALLPSVVVCCLCLSHDFSSIIVSLITSDSPPSVREIPLCFARSELRQRVRDPRILRLLARDPPPMQKDPYWHVLENFSPDTQVSTLYVALRELDRILEVSGASLRNVAAVKTASQKRRWWKKRRELDADMKVLADFVGRALWNDPCEGQRPHVPTDKHIVLVLDKILQRFPWEICGELEPRSVSRMPSLHMLYSHLLDHRVSKKRTVDLDKTFYVVNPDRSLKRTQEKFIESFSCEKSWKGLLGEPPTPVEFENALKLYDMFVYVGHGGGEEFIHLERVKNSDRCCNLALLMGCSSGALRERGEYEPTGSVLNYLLAGGHCIVANLWEVTDRDCDRFTFYLLEKWMRRCDDMTPVTAVIPIARKRCYLPYLIGGAPVTYGLPVYKRGR